MKKRMRDQSPKTGRKMTSVKKISAKKGTTVTEDGAAILETGFRSQEAFLLQGKLFRTLLWQVFNVSFVFFKSICLV